MRLGPAVVRVTGRSMLPTYAAGDLLLVVRGVRARPGRPAVVRLPPDPTGRARPVSVKRITGLDPDDPSRWWFDSDNARDGVSAFDTGSLTSADVIAVVLCRVSPRWGRLRGTTHRR